MSADFDKQSCLSAPLFSFFFSFYCFSERNKFMSHIALGLTRQLTNTSVPQDRVICIDMVKLYYSPCSLKKQQQKKPFLLCLLR